MAEVLLSFTLLTIVCLVLVGLLTGAQAGAGTNGELQQASAATQDHLRDLKNGSFTDLETFVDGSMASTVTVDGRDFQLETEVTRMSTDPASPDYQVLHLRTTTRWISSAVDPGGRHREAMLRLQTHVARSARY